VLERGISIAIVADGAMAVLVVVVSPGTREEEFGEDKLTLMPVAALTLWSITMTMAENRGNNQLKKKEHAKPWLKNAFDREERSGEQVQQTKLCEAEREEQAVQRQICNRK